MVDLPPPSEATPPAVVPPFPALPSELSIYTAAETRQRWLSWWDASGKADTGTLHADGSAVEVVDGAGMQLLVALQHYLRRHQVDLALQRPSEPLRSACAAMGLAGLLHDGGSQ